MPVPSADALHTESVNPEELGDRSDPNVFLAIPNDAFVWVFHHEELGNWHPIQIEPGEGVPDEDVGMWWLCLPSVSSRRFGLNGNRPQKPTDSEGHGSSVAREIVKNQRGIWLDSVGEYAYLQRTACEHPITRRSGFLWHDRFSTPVRTRAGQRPRYNVDRQGMYRFLLKLIRDGVVPTTHIAEAADSSAARVAAHVRRTAIRTDLRPEVHTEELERLKAKGAAVAAAREPEVTPPEPRRAPKSRRAGP